MTPHFGLPEFGFLLRGLQWTVLLTLVAFVGGCTAGLIVALLRTCGRTTVEWMLRIYIGIFQGTPLLLQLFVVYYGLALHGLKLSAFVAVAIGFTVNATAFLGEIWRGSEGQPPLSKIYPAWRHREKEGGEVGEREAEG